ncbi:MAG: UDP-N-acetylmuramate dehydrogenase [Firmicutes bacterium]|nr:UDP-N-acetylmuramate dehydrogenase [Bacillota bacterium]
MADKNFVRIIEGIVGKDNIKINEPMKNHTSFKVGGPADILVTPENISMLDKVLNLCKKEGVPYFIMGNGTNLVVRDKGIRGVVIKTGEKLNKYSIHDNVIEAEAGILLSELSLIALENALSGLEFASGIPGTLGGAVTMNAGAYGGEMKDVVIKTQYISPDGKIKTLEGEQHRFGYRTSFIQKDGGIVLKSWLKLYKDDKAKIREQIECLTAKRKKTQPLDMPSAGSIFKRPQGYYTAPLIEECGLKGYSIGGAQVSMKHCGFIVNTGGATAQDVISVIKYIQNTIKNKYGLELETEVKIVGEE